MKYVFLSTNSAAYRSGFPGMYLSARENLRQNEEKYINEGYHVTVLGPPGVKDWFVEAWSFLGRMLGLRVIEMTSEDANKE